MAVFEQLADQHADSDLLSKTRDAARPARLISKRLHVTSMNPD